MRKPRYLVAFASVAALLVGVGVLSVNSAQSDGDLVDTGPERGILMIDDEIAFLEEAGAPEDSDAIRTLQDDRARLVELAAQPPKPVPDPAEVERLLNLTAPPSDLTSSEYECEGSSLTKGVDFPDVLRCLTIGRENGNRLDVWLTEDGWAFTTLFLWDGLWDGGRDPAVPPPEEQDIPAITDLASVILEIVGEDIRITSESQDITIRTQEWFSGAPGERP